MIRAVLRDGVIYPLDPVPSDWSDGQEVLVHPTEPEPIDSPEAIDRWYQELEQLVAELDDPEDHQRLEAALEEADRIAKEQVRREMGLP